MNPEAPGSGLPPSQEPSSDLQEEGQGGRKSLPLPPVMSLSIPNGCSNVSELSLTTTPNPETLNFQPLAKMEGGRGTRIQSEGDGMAD